MLNASSTVSEPIARSTAASAQRPGLHGDRSSTRRHRSPRRATVGDPLRSARLRGGGVTLASVLSGARHLRGRPQPERPDGARCSSPVHRADRDAERRHRDHGATHDARARPASATTTTTTIPLGRLHQHAARALEPRTPARWPVDPDAPPRRRPLKKRKGAAVAAVRVPPGSAQADLRRCRTIRRRSRSVVPPQTPSRSRWARACSRHAWRTGQTAQTALASAASASSSVDRVERLDVEAPAGGLLAPRGGDHGKHFLVNGQRADTCIRPGRGPFRHGVRRDHPEFRRTKSMAYDVSACKGLRTELSLVSHR